MKNNNNNGLFITALVLAVVLGFGLYAMAIGPKVVEVEKEVLVEVPVIVNVSTPVNDEVGYLYNKATEEDRQEAEAEALVLDELDTKDFKQAVFDELTDVESYKDLSIVVKDTDVELNDEDAVVEVEFKVYYYLDGDEEETEKALFTAVFNVSDLVDEDDFEDAEAELDSVNLVKVY